MDVYVVLSDNAPKELVDKMEGYISEFFEIRVLTLSELQNHAIWGSDKDWDRYNFPHNKPVIDKTDEVAKIMEEKGILPEEARRKLSKIL